MPRLFRTLIITSVFGFIIAAFLVSGSMAANEPEASGRFPQQVQSAKQTNADTATQLQPGQTLNPQIFRDETQVLTVRLEAGQYAEVTFEWSVINLGVSLFDPQGKKLLPADCELNSNGPLSISIVAEAAGVYRLNITALVRQRIGGKYRVTLSEPRLPTDEDRVRIEAQTELVQPASTSMALKIEHYDRAAKLLENANDHARAARALMLLGDAYRAANDFANSKASYKQAGSLWNLVGNRRGEAYSRLSLSIMQRSASLQDSLASAREAELLFAEIDDQRGQADALYSQSYAFMKLSEPSRAIELLQKAMELRQANGDVIGELSAMNMKADAHRIIGESDASQKLYDQAIPKLKGLDYRLLEAAIIVNEGLIDHDEGSWDKARDKYAGAVRTYEEMLGASLTQTCLPKPASNNRQICAAAATALDNLGQVLCDLQSPDKAMDELAKALQIRQAIAANADQGVTLIHIGYAEYLLGDSKKALENYQLALDHLDKVEYAAEVALTYTYMGLSYQKLNEPRTALECYKRGVPNNVSPNQRALAIALDNLGNGYELTGDTQDALINYAQALKHWRMAKDPEGEALTHYHTAVLEARGGNAEKASQSAAEAIALVDCVRTRLRAESSRTGYLADKLDYYKLDIDLKMQLGATARIDSYTAAALESSEKARARVLLDELLEAKVLSGVVTSTSEPRLTTLAEKRADLDRRLENKTEARGRLSDSSNKQIGLIDRDIEAIRSETAEVNAQIKLASPRFDALSRPQPASYRLIQQQLDPDSVLLEYSLAENRSYVWAVTPDSIKGFQLPPRAEIEKSAQRIVKSLADRNRTVEGETSTRWERRRLQAEAEFDTASAELSEKIIRPLAPLLGTKRLIVVADGALQFVSFAALPLGDKPAEKPRRLVDYHEIVYEPSASVLALQRSELANRQRGPHAVAVLANPVFGVDDPRVAALTKPAAPASAPVNSNDKAEIATRRGDVSRALEDLGLERFPRLPSSAVEAQKIVNLAPKGESKSATDFDASRETAMSKELSEYRIVHFATHAVVNYEHPELSGIVLSLVDRQGQPRDGYLRLHDIYNLNLPADLIVLSACQTGVGKEIKGEGLIALTRGFMYAGAERVVASLWKVDDVATAELMGEFYKQMFVNGQRPAAALHSAQIVLARKRSPVDWAGFVLQGEWK